MASGVFSFVVQEKKCDAFTPCPNVVHHPWKERCIFKKRRQLEILSGQHGIQVLHTDVGVIHITLKILQCS